MRILNPLIRIYFFNCALDQLWEKLYWNFKVAPELRVYPPTREGVLEAVRNQEFYVRWGLKLTEEGVSSVIDNYGLEYTLGILSKLVMDKGGSLQDD